MGFATRRPKMPARGSAPSLGLNEGRTWLPNSGVARVSAMRGEMARRARAKAEAQVATVAMRRCREVEARMAMKGMAKRGRVSQVWG